MMTTRRFKFTPDVPFQERLEKIGAPPVRMERDGEDMVYVFEPDLTRKQEKAVDAEIAKLSAYQH